MFSLGQVVATPGALDALSEADQDGNEFLVRHARGDWGEVDAEDKATNDAAVKNGQRLLSSYALKTGQKLWIITEWDRSVTTLLLPDEY